MPAPQSSNKISIEVSKTLGSVSANIHEVNKPVCVLMLAHGAGAGMDHPFMVTLASELGNRSVITIRYNFPFMENGKKRPDPPAIAEKTIEAVMNKAHSLYPKLPSFAAGKSFGGRMTSQRLSKNCPVFIRGIVFFGFPLHPAGAPAIGRATHLSTVKVPMLFLQGTKDALATMDLMEGVVKKLPLATLKKYEGADHSFKVPKKQMIDVLAEDTYRWITRILSHEIL